MAIRYLVPPDHLPVSGEDGKPDHRLMAAAHAALFSNYRGQPYNGPDKEGAKSRLRALYKSEGMEWPGNEQKAEGSKQKAEGDGVALSIVNNGRVRIAIAYSSPPGCSFIQGHGKEAKKFTITDSDLTEMKGNLDDREAPIDYEHNMTLAVAPPGFQKAAGWVGGPAAELSAIEPFTLRDGSNVKMLWSWARFTPVMAAMVKQHEYRYFSPWFKWNDSDQFGNGIGTRLKAGGMTNTPFLEELPPIEISDADYQQLFGLAARADGRLAAVALSARGMTLMNVDSAHVQGPASQISVGYEEPASAGNKGGSMASKSLCMKCSADGKHQVFDGDGDGATQLGEFEEKHLKTYAKNHLGMVEGGDNASAKAVLLKDLGFEGKDVADVKAVLAKAVTVTPAKPEVGVLLKELSAGDGKLDSVKLRAMVAEGGERAKFAFDIRDAEDAVSAAFKAKRLKPAARDAARELFLTNRPAFDKFVAAGAEVVDNTSHGHGTDKNLVSTAEAFAALKAAHPEVQPDELLADRPGTAYALLKEQATKLMEKDKNLRLDQAILKVAQKSENEFLCKQWRKDQGFPEAEESDEE